MEDYTPSVIDVHSGGVTETRASWTTAGHPQDPVVADILGLSATTSAGENVTERNSMTYSAVHAAVRVLSETVASIPLVVYRRRTDGRGKDPAPKHPLYRLLHDAPNEEQDSVRYREAQQAWLALWGNAYARIRRTRSGQVYDLWPMPADRTVVKRDDQGRLYYQHTDEHGRQSNHAGADVLHIANLGDGVVGWSPIRLHREGIGLGKAAERYGAELFANDARPLGHLETPDLLSDKAYGRLKSTRQAAGSKHGNRHKIEIFEQGLKWVPHSIPPDDAQFLQTREFEVVEIARIYRIAPHILQDLTHGTFSNIEELGREFLSLTMLIWFRRWEAEINRKLFPDGEYFCEFNIGGFLRGDQQKRYQAYATGRQWGWLSANDIRALENMNPVDGGDLYLTPMNMVPADHLAKTYQDPDPPKPKSKDPPPAEPSGDRAAWTRSEKRARSLAERHTLKSQFAPLFRDAASRVVRREIKAIQAAATKHLAKGADLVGFNAWIEDWYPGHQEYTRAAFLPVLGTYSAAVAEVIHRELDQSALGDDALEKLAAEYARISALKHNASSKGQLRQLAREAATPEEAAEEIALRMEEWESRRPDKITERQTACGLNQVARAVYLAAGIQRLVWVTAGSDVCQLCQQLDGRTVAIDQPFVPAGTTIESGTEGTENLTTRDDTLHPPLHEGCTCGIAPA